MTTRLRLVRAVRIDAEQAVVRDVLSRYELLPAYEHKVRAVRIDREGTGAARVQLRGRFALLPWSGTLRFRDRDGGGFDSAPIESTPLVGFSGGFGVRRASDGRGCVVTHVERYVFRAGTLGRILAVLARPFLSVSIGRELRRLKRLVEEPALLVAAQRGGVHAIRPGARRAVWNPAA